jgi:hypothetical protein
MLVTLFATDDDTESGPNDDDDPDDADDPDGAFDLHFCPPVTTKMMTRRYLRPLDVPDDVYYRLGAFCHACLERA